MFRAFGGKLNTQAVALSGSVCPYAVFRVFAVSDSQLQGTCGTKVAVSNFSIGIGIQNQLRWTHCEHNSIDFMYSWPQGTSGTKDRLRFITFFIMFLGFSLRDPLR